jgi:putative transposase
MKRNRYTEEQIISFLKANERGVSVAELARQNGATEQTLYRWKARYSGMEVSEAKRLRELEAENARLKKLLAESALDNAASRRSSRESGDARSEAACDDAPGGRWLAQPARCLPIAGLGKIGGSVPSDAA